MKQRARQAHYRQKQKFWNSQVTCVGTHPWFSSVCKLFDLLSLSYHNEPFPLQHGMCSAFRPLLPLGSVDWWSLWPVSAQHSFEGSFSHLFCLMISAVATLCLNEQVLALFSSLESSKSEELEPINLKVLIDHGFQYPLVKPQILTHNAFSLYVQRTIYSQSLKSG